MKKLKNQKHATVRILLLFVAVLCTSAMRAQSTVYVFNHSTNSCGDGGKTELTINGAKAIDMRGPLKRVMANVSNPSMPLHMYKAAKRTIIMKEEGKALFAIDYEFVTGAGRTSHMTGEVQINLSEGSVHYLKVTPKGLNDLQFKVLSEKEGKKLLNNKKYVELPDVTL